MDGTGRTFDLDAGAGVFVQRLAVLLQRRVHRRKLVDGAGETRAGGCQHGLVHLHRTLKHDVAFAVAADRGLAELQRGRVGLVRVEADLRELGGSTEADRQQAGGQRVERAGVARLLRLEDALDLLQRVIAGQADGLVEQQNAMQRPARDAHGGRTTTTTRACGAFVALHLRGRRRCGWDQERS